MTHVKQPSFWRSLGHAADGLWLTLRTQRNARIHVFVGSCAVLLGMWLQLDRTSWCLLAITIAAVLAGETINTSVEALVDILSPEYHERAKVAKDVAAGGVLLLSTMAVIVGLLVLGPPLWKRVIPPPHPTPASEVGHLLQNSMPCNDREISLQRVYCPALSITLNTCYVPQKV